MAASQDVLNIFQCSALCNVKPHQLSLVVFLSFGHYARKLRDKMELRIGFWSLQVMSTRTESQSIRW